MRQLQRSEAIGRLNQQPTAWVRVAVVRYSGGDDWKLRLLEITTGEVPPSWQPRLWRYPTVVFDSYAVAGAEVYRMLVNQFIQAGSIYAPLDPQNDLLDLEHRPSRSHYGPFESLEWPVEEIKLNVTETLQNEPTGELLSDGDAPSFSSFAIGAAHFFSVDGRGSVGQINPDSLYRHQDRRGRIAAVRVFLEDDRLEVEVSGDALDGLTLELAGGVPGPKHVFEGTAATVGPTPHLVQLDLAGGLRPGAWIVLRNGSEMLDRRDLTSSLWWANDGAVTIIEDQATRLEALVGGWEREGVEFKRQMPSKSDQESKLKLMKSVCAFANGDGGSVLIGVDDDDRSYVGIHVKSLDNLERQLSQMVRSWVDPCPELRFGTLPIPESEDVVLEMVVRPGNTLFVCGQNAESRRPYVRHHSSTEVASRMEILAITGRGAQISVTS